MVHRFGNSKETDDLYASRHITVEYTVTGRLDGVTQSPALVTENGPGDTNNIYRVTTGNLGLINPTEGLGVLGPRMIDWIWINTPLAAPAGSAIATVAVRDLAVGIAPANLQVLEGVADFAGQSNFYMKQPGTFLWPGSALRISGNAQGSVADPILVRLGIAIPDQDALLSLLAAHYDTPGMLPLHMAVETVSFFDTSDPELDVQATYIILTDIGGGTMNVHLPESARSFYWGPGEMQTNANRSGRVYFVENQAGASVQFMRAAGGDTINGAALDPTFTNTFFIVVNRGDGDWRVNAL